MLVCLDSSLLIYIKQQQAPEGHEDLFRAADAYETWLEQTDCGILLPTPVISEIIGGKDPNSDLRFLKRLQQFTDVTGFDARAAHLAARLRNHYWNRNGLPSGLDRQILKVDMMISAIAIVNRAAIIVTHDTFDFEQITENHDISIRGVDEGPPGQSELF